jgi:hypothetical protein
MAKVVVTRLKSDGRRGATSVTEKRVRGPEGQMKTVRTLDAGSRTFGDDLQYVFSKNVAKARRDNKRVVGTTDVAIAKR